MGNSVECTYDRVTHNDIQLATVYYPILIDLAKHKHCLTYGELVDKAKKLHPDLAYVKNAIPVSTGRKLDVIRIYTKERDLPDLSSLIINKNTGEVGSGFPSDPDATREKVFALDWEQVSTEFEWFVREAEKKITPRKKRKEPEARELMYAYYKEHKNTLPPTVTDLRELIIELLMEGFSAEEAYELAQKE